MIRSYCKIAVPMTGPCMPAIQAALANAPIDEMFIVGEKQYNPNSDEWFVMVHWCQDCMFL